MSLGPQNPTKKLTHWVDLLGHLLSRNYVSNLSDLGPHIKRNLHQESVDLFMCPCDNICLMFDQFCGIIFYLYILSPCVLLWERWVAVSIMGQGIVNILGGKSDMTF